MAKLKQVVLLFSCLFAASLRGNIAREIPGGYDHYEDPKLSIFNGAAFLCPQNGVNALSLDSIRQILVDLEDTIIFSLIGRAKLALNNPAYNASSTSASSYFEFNGSLMEFLVRGTEAIQSQGGRYQSPEEVPYFPDHLAPSFVHPHNCSQELPSAAASVTVNNKIWDSYLNQFLPLLAAKGDDGNYALSVSSDLVCLQALSRRIHYGKFVAEAKFRGATEAYSTAIRANDTDALTNLLTDEKVEVMVKERVEKKGMIFGQHITLSETNNSSKLTIDPLLLARLYDELVIPLTKEVEIQYLLRRLDD